MCCTSGFMTRFTFMRKLFLTHQGLTRCDCKFLKPFITCVYGPVRDNVSWKLLQPTKCMHVGKSQNGYSHFDQFIYILSVAQKLIMPSRWQIPPQISTHKCMQIAKSLQQCIKMLGRFLHQIAFIVYRRPRSHIRYCAFTIEYRRIRASSLRSCRTRSRETQVSPHQSCRITALPKAEENAESWKSCLVCSLADIEPSIRWVRSLMAISSKSLMVTEDVIQISSLQGQPCSWTMVWYDTVSNHSIRQYSACFLYKYNK